MTQTIPLGSDARERFVLEIAKVLAPERIVEAHLFAPLRQGQIETGVCVLAALPEGADPLPSAEESEVAHESTNGSHESAGAQGEHLLSEEAEHRNDDQAGSAASDTGEASETTESAAPVAAAFPEGARISSRHVVYSARYRWTRKGPDRGKWECEVVAEADAPLLTVEAVVQGVQRRSSEPPEVQRLDGDTVRAMIAQAQQQWQKTA